MKYVLKRIQKLIWTVEENFEIFHGLLLNDILASILVTCWIILTH